MRRFWIMLVLAALAAPLWAGIEYEARTWQEGQQKNRQADMTVLAKVDGDRARIEFRESGNPWMAEGTYLLTTDAGRTLVLVNPQDQTYGEFDLDAIMGMLGALSDSGMVEFEVENPRLEALPAGSGKSVAGLSTKNSRYRTSYDMRIKVLGFKRMQRVETVSDVYYTEAVGDAAMGVWLSGKPPRTNTDLDQLIDLHMETVKGFPLDTTQTMTTTGKKGKQTTTITRTVVSRVDRGASFPAGTFDIPDGYTPVQMMPTPEMMAGGQPQPEQQADGQSEPPEEKKGLMGRLKKFGKKKE